MTASLRKPLLWALALSVLLHLGLLFGPDIEFPTWSSRAPLTVKLQAPPPPKTIPPIAPKPARRVAQTPPPRPVPSAPPPVAPINPAPNPIPLPAAPATPAPAPVAPAPPPAPVAAPEPALPAFPNRLTLTYTVYGGEGGFQAGRTVHTWAVTNDQYLITSTTEATGLAALFLRGEYRQTSRGELTPAGLKPSEFTVQRGQDGQPTESANFDWKATRLSYGKTNDKREVSLPPGAQDQLSVFYQLALTAPHTERVRLLLTNGRKIYLYEYQVLGDEVLDTPMGKLKTQHLARVVPDPDQGGADVWLAYDHHFLPVRFRLKPGGRILDHVIETIRAPGDGK